MCFFRDLDSTFTSLGCWKDVSSARAIDGNEGRFGGKGSKVAIQECFERAKDLGHDVFAVQDGNECFTTPTAEETYKIYGTSNGCSASGTGGHNCQDVYKIGKKHIEQA